jgi:hypothetical protein
MMLCVALKMMDWQRGADNDFEFTPLDSNKLLFTDLIRKATRENAERSESKPPRLLQHAPLWMLTI